MTAASENDSRSQSHEKRLKLTNFLKVHIFDASVGGTTLATVTVEGISNTNENCETLAAVNS